MTITRFLCAAAALLLLSTIQVQACTRYVRFYNRDTALEGESSLVVLLEIGIYVNGVNVAPTKSITATSCYGPCGAGQYYPPTDCIDGDTNTFCSTGVYSITNSNQYLLIDMGEPTQIERIEVVSRDWRSATTEMRLELELGVVTNTYQLTAWSTDNFIIQANACPPAPTPEPTPEPTPKPTPAPAPAPTLPSTLAQLQAYVSQKLSAATAAGVLSTKQASKAINGVDQAVKLGGKASDNAVAAQLQNSINEIASLTPPLSASDSTALIAVIQGVRQMYV